MNSTNTNLFTTISKAETKNLTTVVAETLALNLNSHKPFTAAQMWSIQRRKRSFTQRRFNA